MSADGMPRPGGPGHGPQITGSKAAPAAKFRELNELRSQLKEVEIKVTGWLALRLPAVLDTLRLL